METPSPSYIISRAIFLIALLVAGLFTYGFVKKQQRQKAIIIQLQSITSDSSFFRQFYAEDARKALVRAVGLLVEANTLGLPPDTAINRGMGIKEEFFAAESEDEDPPAREKIIRNCLRGNYENFVKLGYTADFHTLEAMRKGELPPISSGPHTGRRAEVGSLIDPSISPGMDKVVANLEIRPPTEGSPKLTDIQVSAAKQLARDLSSAQIIEEAVRDRIIETLSKQTP